MDKDYEKHCGCKNDGHHKHNRGVMCDVKNCAYHDGECYCQADQISVGPSDACSCSDTVCATFKKEESQT